MELEQINDITPGEISDFSDCQPDELDLPPEYCHYRDEGCEFADSCLNCPLTKCIYDEPGGRQRWLKRQRDRQIVKLFTTEGKRVKELALMFGLSQRTVQRALKNSLLTPSSPPSLKRKIKREGKLERIKK